ncbi:hypothetical protein ABT093_18585 [Kitasatospora sp. NPDC002551]|uniref:hypothetical protein n=1 Tax=unclassified Kitasatospora TaxID=2633591 RepID=UPI00332DB20F
MLLFGLLLVAATAAFTGLLIADNLSGGPEYQVTILGNQLVTLDSLGIFLAGLALALLFCLGLALAAAARRRARTGPVRRTAVAERAPRTDGRTAGEPVARERTEGEPVAGGPVAAAEGAEDTGTAGTAGTAGDQGDRTGGIPREPARRSRLRRILGPYR